MKKLLVPIAIAVIGVLSAACGTAHSASQDAAKAKCAYSFSTWYYHKGGKAEIHTLDQEVTPMVRAAENRQQGQAKKDAATVEKADTQLQRDMPPNCVPNLDTNLRAMLVAINTDARDATAKNPTAVKAATLKVYTNMKASAADIVSYAHGGK